MTPGQAQWLMWLFGAACGGILGVLVFCLGAANSHSRMADRIDELRVALGDLARAVEGERVDKQSEFLKRALDRTRDVLSGKGAE